MFYLLNSFRLTGSTSTQHHKTYFQVKLLLLVIIIPITAFGLVSSFSENLHLLVIVPVQVLMLYWTKVLLDGEKEQKGETCGDVKVCIVEDVKECEKDAKNLQEEKVDEDEGKEKSKDVVVAS